MVNSVLTAQKPQQSRSGSGEQALMQQRDNLLVVLIAGVCNDLKENPTLLLIMRPSPHRIRRTEFKINWIGSCSAHLKSDASIYIAQCWKRDPVLVVPSLEKTPRVKYSFLPRPVGLKLCLWVLYVIYFRERNPAGGTVFKQRLVNGLSLSRPKACWVPWGRVTAGWVSGRGRQPLPLGWPPSI